MGILDPKPPTRAELSATYAQQWKANTAYSAGQAVINPSGDTVTAKAAFTSGSSYDATKWNTAPGLAAKIDTKTAAARFERLNSRIDPYTPRLPLTVTSDAPTITYTDSTVGSAAYPTLVLPTDSRLTFYGFLRGTRNVSGNNTWINIANGYLGSTDYAGATEMGTYAPYAIEFDHYGLGVELDTLGLQAISSPYYWQVFVDGKPVSLTPLAMTNTGNAYGQYAKIAWSTAKLRRIRLRIPPNITLRGIRLSSANDSLSPVPKTAPKLMVLGDSWTEGTGTDPASGLDFPRTLALLSGWDVYRAGQGGTGYVNQGTANASEFGSTARLNAVADIQPDYLLVAGTSNDDANTATVGAAAAALYASVATRSPNTRIIVLGPQNTSATVSASRESVRAAIIGAAQAAPNVALIIDPITDKWITGNGTVSAPGTAGNASVLVGGSTGSDGAHLNQAGYDYWARRVFAAIGQL